MNLALLIYLVIGVGVGVYVTIMHFIATFIYIRQLYTAKEVTPTKISTYFGIQFWEYEYSSDWDEIFLITTIQAALVVIMSVIAWPFGFFLLFNNSVKKARARIEKDSQ